MPRTRWTALLSMLSVLATAAAAHAAAPNRTSAAPVRAGPPALNARSAILVEALTGAVLFESRADERIPPASLTKLMTLHLALQEIEEGRLNPSEVLVPGPDAWARNMPPRSSVMLLGPNQKLTVEPAVEGSRGRFGQRRRRRGRGSNRGLGPRLRRNDEPGSRAPGVPCHALRGAGGHQCLQHDHGQGIRGFCPVVRLRPSRCAEGPVFGAGVHVSAGGEPDRRQPRESR